MEGLSIKRAILEHNERYGPMSLGELAKKVYPELVNPSSKLSGLINGSVKISREEVDIICRELRCDPNKLFGYDI